MSTKIENNYLLNLNKVSNQHYFGDWVNYIDELKEKYINAEPYEHIIIHNFLNEAYAELIHNNFPKLDENWHKYYNPIEIKYTNDNINNMDENIKKLFHILSTNELINIFSKLTGIENLDYDPYLHGAGLHMHPRNGRLHIHLDYEKHPFINKKRSLNLILYLSKDWKEEWNGHTELWNKTECIVKSPVIFNTAIIFKTNDDSWHGLPEIIKCPQNVYRNSFAFYYISDITSSIRNDKKIGNDGTGYRTKATFIKRQQDPDYIQIQKLYDIRSLRRIEKTDIDEIWPEWNEEL